MASRAYDLAREGHDVELAACAVHVDSWVVGDFSGSELRAVISCGAGTYVRALARDLGRLAGSAAHLVSLRRVRTGPFDVAAAVAARCAAHQHPAVATCQSLSPSDERSDGLSDEGDSQRRARFRREIAGTVITVGTFDGVHRGHLEIIHRLVERARSLGLPSVAVTFEPHPLDVVNPAAAPLLLTVGDEKVDVLAATELDYLVILPFTHELSTLSAERFVDELLRERLAMRGLLVGHDHGFGRERAGNAAVLRELGAVRGFAVEVVEPVAATDGRWISSTAIRRAVAGGDLHLASDLLGRPYSVAGDCRPRRSARKVARFPHHQSLAYVAEEASSTGRRLRRFSDDGSRCLWRHDEPRPAADVRRPRALHRGVPIRRERRLL